jgi:hypothetical protein
VSSKFPAAAKAKASTSMAPAKPTADPLAMLTPKKLGVRVGLPLLVIWVVALVIMKSWSLIGAGAISVVATVLVVWGIRFANKTRAVASLVSGADTPEARKLALAKLDTEYKKSDTAAIFARAQLLMSEDPRKALEALEQIDLKKVMAPIADEARAQRAMIHLLLGEADQARMLVDPIELSRHQQPKTRATIASVVAEAWARTGQGKKALDTLSVFDPEDAEFTDLKPQIWRAFAFSYAATNDMKGVRKALRKLLEVNPQLLGGFLMKRVHPLLEREAKELLKRSNAVPRKMIVKRM